jgi:uncharacterized protein
MPSNATAKTKLVPKRTLVQLAMIVALVATIFGVIAVQHDDATPHAVIAGRTYSLEIADTDAARAQGLSNRVGMAQNHGMLFRYANQGVRCFWMKDMHFSLDIIWLNAQSQAIKIERNVSPDTYPHPFCASPAQNVLELNAGAAQNLRPGQIVQL